MLYNFFAISLFQHAHHQQPHPVPNHPTNPHPLLHIRNPQPPNPGFHQYPRHNRRIMPISIGFYNSKCLRTRMNIGDRLHRAQVFYQPLPRDLNPTLHPPIITSRQRPTVQKQKSDLKSPLLSSLPPRKLILAAPAKRPLPHRPHIHMHKLASRIISHASRL